MMTIFRQTERRNHGRNSFRPALLTLTAILGIFAGKAAVERVSAAEAEDRENRRSEFESRPADNAAMPNFSSDLKMSPPLFSSRIYYEGSETLGRVGNEAILKRDIFHRLKSFAYMEFLRQRESAPDDEKARFNDDYFRAICGEFLANNQFYSQVLEDYICQLLFYNDYVVSRSKEELDEQKKSLGKVFDNEYLTHLLDQMKCENRDELEEVFKEKIESSLEEEKRLFIQKTLGDSWLEYNLGAEQWQPTIHDLRRYYESHRAEFEIPERVRWQKMTVYFANHPSKEAAFDKIAYMGNAVQSAKSDDKQEKLFAQVARTDSEDLFAEKGGYCDWTEKGHLSSPVIEDALFSEGLPVGSLSRILEDTSGLSIICVLEREKRHFTPFVELQEKIVDKLKEERKTALKAKYEKELAKRFAVQIYKISPEERKSQLEVMSKEARSATGRDDDENPY